MADVTSILYQNGDLRHQAKEILLKLRRKEDKISCGDVRRILGALEAYQIDLEMQNEELRRTQQALKDSEDKYETLLENVPDRIFLKDRNSVYISCNLNYARDLKISPSEISGKTDYDFYSEERAEKYIADDNRVIQTGEKEDIEENYTLNGRELSIHTIKTPVRDDKGNVIAILGVFRDITKRKQAEVALMRAYDELEENIQERTSELYEANIALRVLLKKIEEDKNEQEQKILSNVKELIMPCIEELRKCELPSKHSTYLDLLESNLLKIISPFSFKLSSGNINLTNKEIMVGNFIKEGKSSKEIADMLNVSKATVDSHRNNIRKKLGLNTKKTNLRTYLSSIESC